MSNKHYFNKLINDGFEKRLNYLKKKLKDKTVIIYGSGRFFNVINDNYNLSEFNIVGISDIKYSQEIGDKSYKGYKIIPPRDIKRYNPDYIILAMENYDDVLKDFKEIVFSDTKIKIIPFVKYKFYQKILNYIEIHKITIMQKIPWGRLQLQINALRYFLEQTTDITKFPQATGVSRANQNVCLDVLDKMVEVINENGMQYWLDAGTLLGAYRHKGFIPWDTDIDICMIKEEMIKIIPALKEKFKDSQYYVREYSRDFKNFQVRIIAKNDSRIGVDIFPVEFYYGKLYSELDKYKADLKIKYARKMLQKENRKKYINDNNMKLLRQRFVAIENKYIQPKNKKEKTGVFFAIDYPYDSRGYLVMEQDMVFPLKQISFEGKIYKCPNNVEMYLENLFNDFMGYPDTIEY